MPDVIALLRQYRIRHWQTDEHKNVRSGFVGVDCPWCHRPGDALLGINITGGFATCWSCGPHSLAEVLHAVANVPWPEAIDAAGRGRKAAAPLKRPRGRLTPPPGVGPLLPCHLAYLAARGLPAAAVARLWGLQGIGLAARLPWSIFIPIHYRGEVVSWTTRAIGHAGRRYVGAMPDEETMSAKDCVYGLDMAGHAVVICEGPADAWAIGIGGVALMGLNYTPAQVLALSQVPVRAICFDAEPAAQRRARKLASILSAYPGVTTCVELASGKDAASIEPWELWELRESCLGHRAGYLEAAGA